MSQPISERIYLINTYLYVYGGLIIIILFCAIMDKFNVFQYLNSTILLIIFILSFVSLFGIMLTPTHNQVLKHIFLLLFLFSISVVIFQWYKIALQNNSLYPILLTLGIIFVTLTVYVYSQPLDAFNWWGSYLMVGLCGLILFQLFDMLFGSTEGLISRNKIYGWITIILFSGFLIYETQRIRNNALLAAKYCNTNSQLDCADYPTESLGLILDFVNLFAGFVRVGS